MSSVASSALVGAKLDELSSNYFKDVNLSMSRILPIYPLSAHRQPTNKVRQKEEHLSYFDCDPHNFK